MVNESDVEGIAKLADISISKEELGAFTSQFNDILEYFDILDQVPPGEEGIPDLENVLREDVVTPSLSQEEATANAGETEDGFIRAPKVM
ncbi:glutamyl amidotransferase [Methanomicrobiaceae archaeon CYW5]|uniref:Asp-tRNA(Asn)/Glu-tRNA(Gln) amidotransferase subunit GatC n=1 Tax=Methanovulcanius yangii TaxID=1789227 RepID=UPI0029C9F953|nr:Asp-tRNA(Asn)/Glu-tRNA(Gln) amidotransferase subunit GatC [Methanovulcanius yangii]MBT8507063.1 glutamyl amidotransferase [Methanovulcanius yangii]